jgi:hypothetical protein
MLRHASTRPPHPRTRRDTTAGALQHPWTHRVAFQNRNMPDRRARMVRVWVRASKAHVSHARSITAVRRRVATKSSRDSASVQLRGSNSTTT